VSRNAGRRSVSACAARPADMRASLVIDIPAFFGDALG
jgi:hypothetical protein